MSSQKRTLDFARIGKEKLTRLSKDDSSVMIDDAVEITNQLVDSALDAQTKEIKTLMSEKQQLCETLDEVEVLWKKYDADLKAKDNQIEVLESSIKIKNEIILKLKNDEKYSKEYYSKMELGKLKEKWASENKMKEMNETFSKLKEETQRKNFSETALLKENNELSTIYNENKQLKSENMILKENVKMKEVQIEKYKVELKRFQTKLTEFIKIKENFLSVIKAQEIEIKGMKNEVKENDAIIIEAERKHQEISKINMKYSSELENQASLIKQKENEMKKLTHVIIKMKQSMKDFSKDSLSEISRLSDEINAMKATNNINTAMDDMWRKRLKETEKRKDEEINCLKQTIYEIKAKMKLDGATHNTTLLSLRKRYQNLLTTIKRKRSIKKGNIAVVDTNYEITEDDDIVVVSDVDNITPKVIPMSDSDKSKYPIVPISENIYKKLSKDVIFDNTLSANLIDHNYSLFEVTSTDIQNTPKNTKDDQQNTAHISINAKDKEHTTANETVAAILNEILQKVEDRTKLVSDDTIESVNTVPKSREKVGLNEIESPGEPVMKEVEREISEDDGGLKFTLPEVVVPAKVELNDTSEAVAATIEQEDVMHETPLISISDADKVGVGNDKIDPIISFNFNVTDTVRKVLLFFYEQDKKIGSEEEFIHLCKQFSYKFRKIIKESYSTFEGSLEGIYLTPDNRAFIKAQIEIYFEKRKIVV